MTEALPAEHRQWLAETPLDSALRASTRPPAGDSERVPRAFLDAERQVNAAGGAAWAVVYARLLLLAQLSLLPGARPELRVPTLVWAEVERGLKLLLDSVPAVVTLEWSEVDFVRNLRAAQLRWLPYDGMVGHATRVHPWYLGREAGWPGRLGLARYLGRDAFRSVTVIEGHEWRGYRELRRQAWETRMARTAALAAVNPSIAGALSRSWVNDPALDHISPALSEKANGIVAAGGYRFATATSAIATVQALAKSETRRRLHAEGKYVPRVYATFFKRAALLRWARARWGDGRGAEDAGRNA